MKTKTYKVYKFDELSEDGKKKAIERYRNINVEDNEFWTNPDGVYEIKKKLLALGYHGDKEIDYIKVLFSGFWSQGDGACFEATIDIKRWLKANKLTRKYQALMKAAKNYEVTAELKHTGRYYHSPMTVLHWDYPNCADGVLKDIEKVDDLILNERRKYGDALYKELEREYDGQTSDEAVMECLGSNDYDFTAGGEID